MHFSSSLLDLFQLFDTVLQRWLTFLALQLSLVMLSTATIVPSVFCNFLGNGHEPRQEFPSLLFSSPSGNQHLRNFLIPSLEMQPHSLLFFSSLFAFYFNFSSIYVCKSVPCWLNTTQIKITTMNTKPKHDLKQWPAISDYSSLAFFFFFLFRHKSSNDRNPTGPSLPSNIRLISCLSNLPKIS